MSVVVDHPHRPAHSAWSPLRSALFRNLWIASVVANLGTWMHEVGAGWLMTSLSSSPSMVALVEAADSFPQDSETPESFAETFMEESWLQHLRHHERVNVADRQVQRRVEQYLAEGESTRTLHWLAARPPRAALCTVFQQ